MIYALQYVPKRTIIAVQIELRERIVMTDYISNLMNDLAMLIEASEIYSEAEYNRQYSALIKEITALGGFQ